MTALSPGSPILSSDEACHLLDGMRDRLLHLVDRMPAAIGGERGHPRIFTTWFALSSLPYEIASLRRASVVTWVGRAWPRAMGCRFRRAGATRPPAPSVRHIVGATPGSGDRLRLRRSCRPNTSVRRDTEGS